MITKEECGFILFMIWAATLFLGLSPVLEIKEKIIGVGAFSASLIVLLVAIKLMGVGE